MKHFITALPFTLLLACGSSQSADEPTAGEVAEVELEHSQSGETPETEESSFSGTPVEVTVERTNELVIMDPDNGTFNHPPHGATGSISANPDGSVALSIPGISGPCEVPLTYVARIESQTVSVHRTSPLVGERARCTSNFHVDLKVGPLSAGEYTFLLEGNQEAPLGQVTIR